MPPLAAGSCEPLYGVEARRSRRRDESSAREWSHRTAETRVAEASARFSRPLHYWKRPTLPDARTGRPSALAGNRAAVQSIASRFKAQNRDGKCGQNLQSKIERRSFGLP